MKLDVCVHLPTVTGSLFTCTLCLPTHPEGTCDVWVESRNAETY